MVPFHFIYDKLTDDEKCPNFCRTIVTILVQGGGKTTPSFMSKTCALDRKKISGQRSLGYFFRVSPSTRRRESTCHTQRAFYDQIVKRTLTSSRSLFSVFSSLVFGFPRFPLVCHEMCRWQVQTIPKLT